MEFIHAPKACASVGPYSHCVKAGSTYYLCGQVPFHPVTGEVVGNGMKEQAVQTLANMKAVLNDIQDGTFAGKWIAENKNGRCFFNSHRDAHAKHPMEVIGKQLREQMLWKNDSNLDNASN